MTSQSQSKLSFIEKLFRILRLVPGIRRKFIVLDVIIVHIIHVIIVHIIHVIIVVVVAGEKIIWRGIFFCLINLCDGSRSNILVKCRQMFFVVWLQFHIGISSSVSSDNSEDFGIR